MRNSEDSNEVGSQQAGQRTKADDVRVPKNKTALDFILSLMVSTRPGAGLRSDSDFVEM